ncbi:MAG: FG-GAP-like repeat-containing protein, partial [Pseudobdellovibrionaceae bacterium]|nr:FG-GAP-like repeat-containing protein [Pseudobdellovibrionaceae bacterium]
MTRIVSVLFLWFVCAGTGCLLAQARTTTPTLEINPYSGSVFSEIPLPALPGRNGFVPELALVYEQTPADRGLGLGQGWALSTSSIQIDTEYGTPHPYSRLNTDAKSKDTYHQLSLDGQALRYLSQGSDGVEYTLESFESRMRILRYDRPFTIQIRNRDGQLESRDISSGFEVRSADGMRRIYSGDAAVAESHTYSNLPSLPDLQRRFISRWPLVHEIKPGGDSIEYHYKVDQGRSYLTSVSFASDRSRYVFHLETATAGPVSYAASYRQESRLYYKGVVACLDEQPQSTWLFAYAQRPVHTFESLSCSSTGESVTDRSRLSENAAGHFLGRAFSMVSNWFSELLKSDTALRLEADLDGVDGLTLTKVYRYGRKVGDPADTTIVREATLLMSYKSWDAPPEGRAVVHEQTHVGPLSGLGYLNNGDLFDANQDGLADVVVHDKTKGANRVFINQGPGHDASPFVEGPAFTVRRKTSSGFQNVVPQLNEGSQASLFLRNDLNGDGWEDLVEIGGDGTWTVFLNRKPFGGDGIESTTTKARLDVNGQSLDLKVDKSFFSNGRGSLIDINGDGKPDILYPILGTDGNAQFQAYINSTRRGSDVVTFQSRTYKFPFATTNTGLLALPEYRLIDVNRDGLVDLVRIVALATNSKGLCLFENQGMAAMSGSALFRIDKPVAGVTCENEWFYPIDDLQIDQSLTETINGMMLMDVNADGAMDFARIDDKSHVFEYWLGRTSAKGFAKKQNLALDATISISKNKYDTLAADVDQDGYEEIISWNAASKSLQIIDLNRRGAGQSLGMGLISQLGVETGLVQDVDYTSYAQYRAYSLGHDSGGLTAVPWPLTLVKNRKTTAVNFLAEGPNQTHFNLEEYLYGKPNWDPERGAFLGFDQAGIFRPGTLRDGKAVASAQWEWFDYGTGLTTLEQRRHLGAFIKLHEIREIPWDGDKEASLATYVTAKNPGNAPWFSSVHGTDFSQSPILRRSLNTYDLTSLPAAASSPTAHMRPAYFIKPSRTEDRLCSGEDTTCQDAKVSESISFHDEQKFRLKQQRIMEPSVSGPKGLVLPSRQLETALEYDESSEQLGIFENVSRRTVKSLTSDRIVDASETNYHPVWGRPTQILTKHIVFDEDRSKLPDSLASKVPTESVTTLTTNYDEGTQGFGTILSIEDDLGLIERYAYGPAFLFRTRVWNAEGHVTSTCYSDRDCDITGLPRPTGGYAQPILIQDAQGYWTRIERDDLGRPLQTVGSLGEEHSIRYEQGTHLRPSISESTLYDGNLKKSLQRSASIFDAEGQLMATVIDRDKDPAWIFGERDYDRNGRLNWQSNPYQASLGYQEWLARGRLTPLPGRSGTATTYD